MRRGRGRRKRVTEQEKLCCLKFDELINFYVNSLSRLYAFRHRRLVFPAPPAPMPLLVKDYTWHETDAEVVLKLPLKGVKPSKVDVTATDRFIKVCRVLQARVAVRGARASAV